MRRLFGMALIAIAMVCGQTARAEDAELDPAKVSESLKAIFQFGSAATKQALNANTVTLISGTIGGTYVQFGADLASVLDDGNKLRVLPIVGRGSVQSVADILFLQGVDLGIVRADTLDYLENKGFAKDIKKQFTYVTKLYNEEMYVIASKSIRSLADLNGKRVSVDLPNGGTFVTASIVFERLGIKPNVVYIEQRIAMEKLKKGELDAVIVVGGKPYKSVSDFKDDGPLPPRSGRLCQAAAERLSAGDPDREGLSEPDRGRRARRHHRGARGAGGLQLGAEHRTLSQAGAVRGRLLHQVPDVPEPALPSEVEGSLVVGAAAGLAAPADRGAMARRPTTSKP